MRIIRSLSVQSTNPGSLGQNWALKRIPAFWAKVWALGLKKNLVGVGSLRPDGGSGVLVRGRVMQRVVARYGTK
jgi:hypothetical protein